jgi:2-polyprenyl-6-methoxyphenol hydroxylase-like FAD-dependent oxidoreductase
MLPKFTDVLIVGAGPTGLVLANQLAARGIEFVIVDRLPQHGNTSRAAVVHARTLERLEELDLAKLLVERGVKVPRFTIRDRDRALLTIDFGRLPTKYPYTLMIPQGEIEEILENRLREFGQLVHRGVEVRDVTQRPNGAKVVVAGRDGRETEIEARYMVGADGLQSLIRDKAGIQFLGGTYEQSFILADVHMNWALASQG